VIVRIEIRGRNVEVDDELRAQVAQRFRRVGKQVSELATLEVELAEERNPSITDRYVAEATLYLKGRTLRAKEAEPEMIHAIHHAAEDIRRQVKKHRDKVRGREKRSRRVLARMRGKTA
jgi:putative sigma-54 modulation protein